MKLLSVALPNHDANISYYDGETVKYIKLERIKRIKRYHIDNILDWKKYIPFYNFDDIIFSFDFPRAKVPNKLYHDLIEGKINGFEFNGTPMGVNKNVSFISHHYAHALSSWMLTENLPNLHIVVDGLGDFKTWRVFKNDKLVDSGQIELGSIGWGMREAGKLLGVKYAHYNDIAGKVMGLQSYGNIDYEFLSFIKKYNIENTKEIFSFDEWVNHKKDILLAKLTMLDWIATVHHKMSEVLVSFISRYANADDVFTYSGGVAQNVVWNTEIRKTFKNVIIPPHSSDEGLSLGGIEYLRLKHNLPKLTINNFPYSQFDKLPENQPTDETIKLAASMLAKGKIIGWYQGNGEVGPRALGNRSILMDPRIPNGREVINFVKKRENYRPFGASVLKEHALKYFDSDNDEYMLFTTKVLTDDFPAITHIDGTCRIQTVGDKNPVFRKLLTEFYNLTGCPVLLNTSLNFAGEPLAADPEIIQQIKLYYCFVGNK